MINLGKIQTAKKVIQAVGNTASGVVDKTVQKDSNNLLLILLIVIVWLYLFFSS